jgi:hypothetical protein
MAGETGTGDWAGSKTTLQSSAAAVRRRERNMGAVP